MSAKIRLGLVGANVKSNWGSRSHVPALLASPDFELTAVCTTRPETAAQAKAAYGARLAFHDFREMAACPDIDAIAVVVRVPWHYEPTRAAIEGGKHVYTEWPLGRTTAEAEEMAALARARGVRTAVGLQARIDPTIQYVKELLAAGHIGQLLAVHVRAMRDGMLTRDSTRTWQHDVSLGAHTLTIGTGHTLDALRFVAGEFASVSSVVATQVRQWTETDTGRVLDVTAPDNIVVSGQLANGAVVSAHIAAVPWAGSGYRMELYGTEGTLVVTGRNTPQFGYLRLLGAQRGNELAEMTVPERFVLVDPQKAKRDAYNVGQLYARFAETVRGGQGDHPTFDTAVQMHRVVDAIRMASETGRRVDLS